MFDASIPFSFELVIYWKISWKFLILPYNFNILYMNEVIYLEGFKVALVITFKVEFSHSLLLFFFYTTETFIKVWSIAPAIKIWIVTYTTYEVEALLLKAVQWMGYDPQYRYYLVHFFFM